MSKVISLLALSVIAFGLAGCGGGSSSPSSGGSGRASASVPLDRAFIDAMVPHHRSAIEMARAAQEAGRKLDPNAGEQLGMSMAQMGMSHGSTDFTGADVDPVFASMMIDHHKGAIAMAELALERSQHLEIKKLARQIIAAQEHEITIMVPLATSTRRSATRTFPPSARRA